MSKFNPKSLPYIAALAQFLQFAHAGYILMDDMGIIIGGVIGGVVSFSVAYSGSQIASVTGQKREKWANMATLCLLFLSPLAIAVPSYISFEVIKSIPLRWITAFTWALAPDLSILLTGLITGKKLVASEESKPKPATKRKKPAFTCSCGRSFSSQAGLNGHQSAHKPKIIAYDVSEKAPKVENRE